MLWQNVRAPLGLPKSRGLIWMTVRSSRVLLLSCCFPMHDRRCERLMLAGGRQGTGGLCSPLRTVWCGLPLTPHGYPKLMSPLRHPCGSAGLLEFLSLLFLSSSTLTLPRCALQHNSSRGPHRNRAEAGAQASTQFTL